MTQSESLQVFLRSLFHRYEDFKTQLEYMLYTLSSNEADEKLVATKQFLTAGSGLALTLATADRPSWLKALIEHAEWYVTNHQQANANHTHLMNIMSLYDQAVNHDWIFEDTQQAPTYSYDEGYAATISENKIDALFNELTETLDQMINSCEIDSVSAIKGLRELISLIKDNQAGSFFSVSATSEFVKRFMKNGTWIQIRKVPGVKLLKDAFEKTSKELDAELDKTLKQISGKISDSYETAIKPTPTRGNQRLHGIEPEEPITEVELSL